MEHPSSTEVLLHDIPLQVPITRHQIRCKLHNKRLGQYSTGLAVFVWCRGCGCLHQLRLEEVQAGEETIYVEGDYGK